jgi:aminoglycoside phosphotransferase (APT) family kinase protein
MRPEDDPTPTQLDDLLRSDWLAAALSDVQPDERIIDVERLDHSQTLAHKVRFAVSIEDREGRRRTRAYCVKGHFDDGPDTLLTEAHVYRELLPRLDLRAPRAYYTGIDEATGRSLIIMDDVNSAGGRFLSAHDPYALDTCREALAQLARLHAATWGDQSWDVDWLAPRISRMAQMFPTEMLQGLLDDGRGANVAAELLNGRRLRDALSAAASLPPTCVIHADTHSGNVYLDSTGRACWLDWQIAQRGHWSTDVSYHIASVLDVADRRAHEKELLRGYLDELGALDIEAPGWDEAWQRYTTGFAWGYFLWVITRISSRAVVLIHLPRIGAALTDHDTFRRLGVA